MISKPKKAIRQVKVEEAMTRDVRTISKDLTIGELKKLFDEYDYNAFPLLEGERLIGMVTKLDLMKTFTMGLGFSRSRYWNLFAEKVEDIMRHSVVSVKPSDSIETVVEYMVEFKLRSIPVVQDNRLVGMISRTDVMKHLVAE